MHVTIYRGPDGMPAWATITGITNPKDPILDGLVDGINDGDVVFAFGDEAVTIEVV